MLAKKPMLKSSLILTNAYKDKASSLKSAPTMTEKDKNNLQEMRSNALWAWIMDLQAAANAQDKENYDDILLHMKNMTDQPDIKSALSHGLLRTAASNDYPAWAISIVQSAAVKMGDEKLYKELEFPLETSIQDAKTSKETAEETLARVNQVLAETNWDERLNSIKKANIAH